MRWFWRIPLTVKAIAEAKVKTDKIDATILAHLLRADLVPVAHAPSQRAREVRLASHTRPGRDRTVAKAPFGVSLNEQG